MKSEIFKGDLVPALVFLAVQIQSQMVLHNYLLVVLHTLGKQLSLLVEQIYVTFPEVIDVGRLVWNCCKLVG